jgi:hypothetical protein
VSGCEALALCGRAACTKPMLAAVFLFDFQHFKKNKNIFEKVCAIKISVVYLYQQKTLKQ